MHDVIVVGSGLAGSSMACALAQRGWDVLVVERQKQAQHKVCGEFLSPEAQASLQALGLYASVAALDPVAIPLVSLSTSRGTRLCVPLPGHAWGLSRYALDEALLTAAEGMGVSVQRGATVTNLEVDEHASRVHIRTTNTQMTASARLSILACGRHPLAALRAEPVQAGAERVQHQDHVWRSSYVGVKCHYTGIDMPAICELFLFEHGYMGVSPTETGAVNACMLISKAAFAQAGASVAGAMQLACADNPALARRLAPGIALPESAVAVAPVDTHRPAAPWGPTARIGDAVSMIPPLCGDGMAMALRSAQLAAPLADAVLRGQLGWNEWAAVHTRAWQHEFRVRIRAGRALQSLLMRPGLGDAILSMGRVLPGAARQVVQITRGM